MRPKDQEEFRRLHEAGLGGRGMRQRIIRRQRKGGSEVVLNISTTPLAMGGGRPAKVMGIILDVTEQERTREELARMNDELEAKVRSRTEHLEQINAEMRLLTSGVSHDLRAPVRAIRGFTESAIQAEKATLSARASADLDRVLQATSTLEDQLEGLMALERSNQSHFRPEVVDIQELALEGFRQLGLDHDWGGHFEALPVPPVLADPEMTRLLLRNLLTNAAKYSAGHSHPRIVLRGEAGPGGMVTVSVRDNGVGFDARHSHNLFQPFQRLHSPSEFSGSGLGLAICKRIVERHGGEIRGESAPGQGATFTFTLEPSR